MAAAIVPVVMAGRGVSAVVVVMAVFWLCSQELLEDCKRSRNLNPSGFTLNVWCDSCRLRDSQGRSRDG